MKEKLEEQEEIWEEEDEDAPIEYLEIGDNFVLLFLLISCIIISLLFLFASK